MAHVLLIEDDPDVARMLKTALAKYGHSVTCSGDGIAGLAQLKQCKPAPDIVVTDILMPMQEGIETIMAIREMNSTIPIVAISGGGRTKRLDFLKTAEKLGANASLAKPFRPADLAEAIEKLLAVKAAPAAPDGGRQLATDALPIRRGRAQPSPLPKRSSTV